MINKNISYYFNSGDSRSRIYYNFDHILELIASNPKLSIQTDMVRAQTTEKAYKEEKHRLPMIAPSGIFDYRNDDPTSLRQYSNILVLDFDDFRSHEAASEFKERTGSSVQESDVEGKFAVSIRTRVVIGNKR